MKDFPHHYPATATATASSNVTLSSDDVRDIESAPPVEFGGEGGHWSPESLLVAAVADCYILSFRAISRASRLDWTALRCDVVGELDRVDRVISFTRFEVSASLEVPPDTDVEKAEKLLHKAESACLITNSLIADSQLSTQITVAD